MQGKPNRGVPGHPRARLIPAHAGKTLISNGEIPKGRAHPRSCGENVMSHAARLRRWGASPLTRGKLRAQDGSADHLGLIPAHAGKTRPSRRSYRKQPAHPRSRGENRPGLGSSIIWPGSSPLTRRKLHVLPQRRHARRLIPAHAGKTSANPRGAASLPAHPRSRGENSLQGLHLLTWYGSSPLTRGKPSPAPSPSLSLRLIPAHAGKTSRRTGLRSQSAAHPRSRGENLIGAGRSLIQGGSSPLTRGKHGRVVAVVGSHRLIPTHAGKTGFRSCVRSSRPTHPRSCGENALEDLAYMPAPGSSPLMRGKLFGGLVRRGLHGLIPAHAGKTGRGSQRTRATRAHPHSRGENYRLTIDRGAYTGSSPLMRGKPPIFLGENRGHGLIPAHAGKTSRATRCSSG